MLRFTLLLSSLFTLCLVVSCDEHSTSKTNGLHNKPQEVRSADEIQVAADSQVQERFLPFAASFSLNPGGENSHTFSIAGSPEGIGLSQSSSQGSGGGPGSFSASQSSSIAAGLNGLSASDSSAFNHNHPLYGPQAQATGNSFAVGQAGASSHGDVINGQAVSGAQSSAGGVNTQASSGASSSPSQNLAYPRPGRPAWGNVPPSYSNGYDVPPSYGNGHHVPPNYASGYKGDYYHNSHHNSQRPSLTISVSEDRYHQQRQPSNGWYETPDSWDQPDYCRHYNGWYRDPRCRNPRVTITKPGGHYRPNYGNRGPYYENIRGPRQPSSNLEVSNVHAGSSAQSGPGGFAVGQSTSQAGPGPNGPTSSSTNHVQSSGNANSQAQGAAVNFNQNNLQASLSSGSISANSRPGGFSQGTSHTSSSKGNSNSHLHGSSSNGGSVHGSATSGNIVFPGPSSHNQNIPLEYVRSSKRSRQADPFDKLVTDLADTVYDVFDY